MALKATKIKQKYLAGSQCVCSKGSQGKGVGIEWDRGIDHGRFEVEGPTGLSRAERFLEMEIQLPKTAEVPSLSGQTWSLQPAHSFLKNLAVHFNFNFFNQKKKINRMIDSKYRVTNLIWTIFVLMQMQL